MPTEDQYRGAMVGLALGDALGAPHEGGPLERMLWRVLGTTSGLHRFTDDTQMSLDLAESLIALGELDQEDVATRFARGYRWDRGYGPGAARVLKRIRAGADWRSASRSVYPEGSYGNGGAMRSPVIGLFFHSRREELPSAARKAAEITHAHPLGIEGAVLIAEATAAALDGLGGPRLLEHVAASARSPEYAEKLALARTWLVASRAPSPKEVRKQLGMGITAPASCVTAVYLAARFFEQPLMALIAFAAEAGGDVDTVSAMAGALWGARNGLARLPPEAIATVEDAARVSDVGAQLYQRSRPT